VTMRMNDSSASPPRPGPAWSWSTRWLSTRWSTRWSVDCHGQQTRSWPGHARYHGTLDMAHPWLDRTRHDVAMASLGWSGVHPAGRWNARCIIPTIVPTAYYTLYTIHYTLYTIHYTLYTIHYTLYTIHYTLNTTYTIYTTAQLISSLCYAADTTLAYIYTYVRVVDR
jgi:hypothetical protein